MGMSSRDRLRSTTARSPVSANAALGPEDAAESDQRQRQSRRRFGRSTATSSATRTSRWAASRSQVTPAVDNHSRGLPSTPTEHGEPEPRVGTNALEFNTTGSTIAGSTSACSRTRLGVTISRSGQARWPQARPADKSLAAGVGALAANTRAARQSRGQQRRGLRRAAGHDHRRRQQRAERNTTGGANVAIGPSAGTNLTTGSNNIDISNQGVAAEAGKIRIGTNGTQTAAFLAA